jgi:hypothetical protein
MPGWILLRNEGRQDALPIDSIKGKPLESLS